MIKRFLISSIIVCLLASSIAVYADVIFPEPDIWYWDHQDEMLQLNRNTFCVNAPNGYVIPREYPGWGDDVVSYNGELLNFKNGEILTPVLYAYVNEGEYWGYVHSGWIPMDDLLVVYERQDFEEENKNNFYPYSDDCDSLLNVKQLVFWQWPGSDREKRVIDVGGEYTLRYIYVHHAYKDSHGREWGFAEIGYDWESIRGSGRSNWKEWICLNDPENSSNIPAFNPAPKPTKWSPDDIYTPLPFEEYSLSNIPKVNTYNPNETFTDVAESAWYHDAVAAAYEYGIIEGKGNNRFNPNGQLTGAETLAIASRIHAYYKYGKSEGEKKLKEYDDLYNTQGQWWVGAYHHCIIEELIPFISSDFYENSFMQIPLTRAQMVHAWAKILQPKDMIKQNTVISLPDVTSNTDDCEDIFLFYEVGIIGGVNAQGTFNPDSEITRAEAATIFMKLIDVAQRHCGRTYGN